VAIPETPTRTSLCTEALKLAGIKNPTVEQIRRAKDEWMNRVFNKIWQSALAGNSTKMSTLQTTAILIGVINQRMFELPEDVDEIFSVSLLDGTHTDTAQGGGASTITLASDEDVSQDDAEGNYILMTSGTSKGQYRQIISYDTSTKVATVAVNWDTGKTPESGDTYVIVDTHYSLTPRHFADLDESQTPSTVDRPNEYSIYSDEIFFDKSLDKSYGIRLRYYANLCMVDLSEGDGTLISRIYRNWQAILEQGVYVTALKWLDDDTYLQQESLFEAQIENLLRKETVYETEDEYITISPNFN
jgi:hypothetical protein